LVLILDLIILFAKYIIQIINKGGFMEKMMTPIMVILISIIVFAVCREIMCWYFKFSEISKKLDKLISAIEGLKVNSIPMKTE
jgi:sorbitol-specific phosphotransferase system component IIC